VTKEDQREKFLILRSKIDEAKKLAEALVIELETGTPEFTWTRRALQDCREAVDDLSMGFPFFRRSWSYQAGELTKNNEKEGGKA